MNQFTPPAVCSVPRSLARFHRLLDVKRRTKAKTPDARDVEVERRIRAQRLTRPLSQTELANKLRVSFQQVQKYEKGVNRVGAGRLALPKFSVAKLLTRDEARRIAANIRQAARSCCGSGSAGPLTSPCCHRWVALPVRRDAASSQGTVLRPHQAPATPCYRRTKLPRHRPHDKKSRCLRLGGKC